MNSMRKRLTDSEGTYKPAREWAALKGISVNALYKMLQRNPEMTIEQAMAAKVNTPSHQNVTAYHGENLTDKELVIQCGCSVETLRLIRLSGKNVEEALDAFKKRKLKLQARKEKRGKRRKASEEKARERIMCIRSLAIAEFGGACSDKFIWHGVEFPKDVFAKLCGMETSPQDYTNRQLDRLFRKHVYRNVLGRKFVPAGEVAAYIGLSEEDVLVSRKQDIYEKIRQKNRNARMFVVNGQAKTFKDWSILYGVPVRQIHTRLSRGWSAERAVTEPVHRHNRVVLEYDGCRLAINEWAKVTAIPALNIRMRLGCGYSVGYALTTPYHARGCQANSRKYVYAGKALSYYGWSKETGINYQTLLSRIRRGWTLERALTEKVS